MGQPSLRKRAKRLLRDLREFQRVDHIITPSTIFAIKHLLQLYKRCKFVEVKIDASPASSPLKSQRCLLPRFIVSQLEGQRLTERRSECVLVPPVVAFVIDSLPSVSGRDKLYPTLFRWYYPPRHRTYYVFAHIKHNMARRTYTLSELLGLRGNQAPGQALAIARNPEIADILRHPGREGSSGAGSNCKPPTARQKDDSSVTSDELLFKGTINRRMGLALTREASHNSMRLPAWEPARDTVRDAVQAPADDPSRQLEWKYRGRSETEVETGEPIPAPSGALAQRDEGFQRFYKAVVSPTHVRVTAGGRIVPNTRGPPSPTVKRTSDHSVMDGQRVSDTPAVGKPPVAPVGVTQPVPVLPPFLPGYPPGFQALQAPVSFVPMALPPGFPFPQAAVNTAAMAQLAPGQSKKDVDNTKAADDSNSGKAKPVMPEPFYYNGQMMYPMGAIPAPLCNPMVPVQMVSIPPGVAPQLAGHYAPPQPAQTTSAGAGSSYAPSNHSLSGIPPVVNHIVPANANFNAASAPPISSIKPSDITKKQIASFKQNLKYHEDQLQYNRHQIDEKEMEQRIQILKGHIQRFEATLQTQLEYEAAHLKATQGKDDKRPGQAVKATDESRPPQPHAPVAPVAPFVYGTLHVKQGSEGTIRRTAPASHGPNVGAGESGKAILQNAAEPAVLNPNGLSNTASLPSDAALAPVFQPRGYASTWTGSKYARELKAYEEAEKRLLLTESKSMGNMRTGDQRSVSQPFTAPTAPAGQAERKHNVSDSSSRSGGSAAKQQSNFGVPYLLGTLPKGVNPRTARDQDYVYNRPLTEEERRARFLYWGKAPKSAVMGLPKYDGKHFYPPSPVKESSAELERESDCRVTDSDADPFRPVTPVQRADPEGVSVSEDNCTASHLTRTLSFETQVNSGSEDCIAGGALLKYHEDGVDENAVDAAERRPDNSGAKLWPTVLKKGPTSSALSSTTAQGLLPHYTGTAAASLSPSLNTNQQVAHKDVSSSKLSDVHDHENASVLPIGPEKRGENCPPGVSSLEDQFKHLSVDVAGQRSLTSAFNM